MISLDSAMNFQRPGFDGLVCSQRRQQQQHQEAEAIYEIVNLKMQTGVHQAHDRSKLALAESSTQQPLEYKCNEIIINENNGACARKAQQRPRRRRVRGSNQIK